MPFVGTPAMANALLFSPPKAAVNDVELARRLGAGDESALREVYQRHSDDLRMFARRLLGDAAAAEDLVHEVFVALHKAIRRFAGERPLRHFLMGVALNHARHHVRAAARRRRHHERLAEPAHPASADASATPEQHLERYRLALDLSRALDTLPLAQRVAFTLCEVEELSSQEAASLAGTSDSTMRARVFRAKRALREQLQAWTANPQARKGEAQ